MRTPKDFDYDLWTTNENGTTHYWTRIKATGEVAEVSHDVMKLLRAEEKRMYRELTTAPEEGSVLSLDVPHDEERESWFEDHSFSSIVMQIRLEEQEFRSLLTAKQLAIYENCLLGGIGIREYAKIKGIDHKAVVKSIQAIQKKFKNYFVDMSPNA